MMAPSDHAGALGLQCGWDPSRRPGLPPGRGPALWQLQLQEREIALGLPDSIRGALKREEKRLPFQDFTYLFVRKGESSRRGERQAEEKQEARCRTRSRRPGIVTSAEGRCFTHGVTQTSQGGETI